ncbi:hypothetical protein [Ruminococcus sp. Marseille-P6503]|uniref:hypothetical protein n=1 Tax=Ruminococcus sp. Marseille-P6503 TaxID=2364796 RepID=UPI000F549F09|nr:hypothetical protein [Ruminococcus sp. Marseille-P6503]
MKDIIFDRDKETENILSFINSTSKSTIIIIKAPVGVGKRSLVQKVCERLPASYNILDIKSEGINEDSIKVKGEYLYNIVCNLDDSYKRHNNKRMCYSTFAKNHRAIRHRNAEKDLLSLSEKGPSASWVFSVALKTIQRLWGTPIEYTDLQKGTSSAMTYGCDYLKYVCSQDKVALILNDVQYMDSATQQNLLETIENCTDNGCIFFFLYNMDANFSQHQYSSLEKYFNSYCSVLPIKLGSLPFCFTMNILQNTISKSVNDKELSINDIYVSMSNELNYINIENLIDKTYELLCKDNKISANSHSSGFNTASDTELFILSLVDIFSGCVLYKTIIFIYNLAMPKENNYLIDKALKSLIEKQILRNVEEEKYTFYHRYAHDKWLNYISENKNNKAIALAAKCASDFCKDNICNVDYNDNTKKVEKTICILVRIFKLYLPVDLSYLLDCIGMVAGNFSSPVDVWNCLEKLLQCIEIKEEYTLLFYNIIEICCELELYQQAWDVWTQIKPIIFKETENECTKINYLYCKLLYLCNKNHELKEFVESNIAKAHNNSSLIYYYIFLIVSMRTNNQYDEIKIVLDEIEKNRDKLKGSKHYGYLLRISEVYKSRLEAIPDIELSVKIFEEYDMAEQAAKSKISLSFLYAITGKLDMATEMINDARQLFENRFKHILCNNEAVVDLLRGIYREPTETLLREASSASNGWFSNAAICNNQVIVYFEQQNIPALKASIASLEQMLPQIVDKHLLAVVSFNLSVATETFDRDKSEKYKKQAQKYSEHDVVLRKRLNGQAPSNCMEEFLLSKPWHIVMLSFWEVDYTEDY